MLIEEYELSIFTPPCDPGAERYAARASLTVEISQALPYLNASLHGANYLPEAKALTWKKAGHIVAFHDFEISVSNVEDRDAAVKELEGLIALVNRIWEERAQIIPKYETRRRPTLMEIFKLLPQTSCKQCGEPTCFTFAAKLAAHQRRVKDCVPLLESQYKDQLARLTELMIDVPYIDQE